MTGDQLLEKLQQLTPEQRALQVFYPDKDSGELPHNHVPVSDAAIAPADFGLLILIS